MNREAGETIEAGTFEQLAEETQTGRAELLAQRDRLGADLPLKFWNQQAHFTTPASGVPEKAIRGLSSVSKILDRFGISPEDIAERSGAPLDTLEEILNQESRNSPFVMVDVEDAVALTEESITKARAGAIRCFTEEDWGTTLPFFRPAGLRLGTCVEDLLTVLPGVAEKWQGGDFPITGIVWPKVEHPEEIVWVCELLSKIEERLGLSDGHIKLEFLVESGYALNQLGAIVKACVHRLSGIVWGIADYSADTNLPSIRNDHPICDWARYEIVNMAGAINVPAIDCMTLNYPTPLHRGSDLGDREIAENKDKILGALKEVYDDAVYGIGLGMTGKWVGHPLQLYMVMTAYRDAIPREQIAKDVKEVEAYTVSVEQGAGATMLGDGRDAYMADRATDRHLRARLRRATAWGGLDGDKALALGLITAEELQGLRG